MGWLIKFTADFFMAFGFIIFCGATIAIYFMDGTVTNVPTHWILTTSLLFAWLRGELIHWPKGD